MSGKVVGAKLLSQMTETVREFHTAGVRSGLGILRYRLHCGQAWGHGGESGYSIDIRVARDGSKAVVLARNNPSLGDPDRVIETMYCGPAEAVRG